jgi:uncharacterized protein YyaL (SSP411 family)
VLIGGKDEAENAELVALAQHVFLPNAVLAYRPAAVAAKRKSGPQRDANRSPQLEPVFTGRAAVDGKPALYVCENFACQAPVVGKNQIQAALGKL